MIARTAITGVFTLEGNSTDLDTNKLDNVPSGGWSPDNDTPTLTGQMIITSVELNAPNGENATFTVNFTGTGSLTLSNNE